MGHMHSRVKVTHVYHPHLVLDTTIGGHDEEAFTDEPGEYASEKTVLPNQIAAPVGGSIGAQDAAKLSHPLPVWRCKDTQSEWTLMAWPEIGLKLPAGIYYANRKLLSDLPIV